MVDQLQARSPGGKFRDMSKLEYFAGQALQGLSANPNFNVSLPGGKKLIADAAWALAQEMMSYYPDEVYTPVINT